MINGDPFTLKDYPYAEDIYADVHDEIIVLKSAQSGLSEYLISTAFWFVDTNKGNPYFAFPKKSDCSIFVQGRFDKALEETPYLAEQMRGKTDNVSIKRYGFRSMYFTGSQKRTQIISNPADIILEDEYDEHNPDVHDTIEKRLNNSKWKWKRRISTPTYPNYGIHVKWLESDKRCWFSMCPYCKKDIRVSGDDTGDRWQDFIGKKSDGNYQYWCPECHSFEFNPIVGQWKITDPEKIIHGYSINRMMTQTCTAKEMIDNYNKAIRNDTVAEFYRSDLGCPFQPKGSRLYESDIMACQHADPYGMYRNVLSNAKYYVGIDTGKKKHCIVLEEFNERLRIVHAEILDKYEDIERIIGMFRPQMVVCDNRPEPTHIQVLNKKYPFVRGAEHNTGQTRPTSLHGKDNSLVGWNRFFSIERAYNHVINKKIGIPTDVQHHTDGEFTRHFTSQMMVEKINDKGERQRDFIPTSGKKMPDHFLFATIFALAARDAHEELQARVPLNDAGLFIL